MLDEMKKIAVNIFSNILPLSAAHHGTFRLLITAKIAGAEKPILIVGNAHSDVEDGHIIAVLNPDEDILNKIVAGCAYGGLLKNIVSGKCDAMLDLWVDAYKTDGVSELSSYKAREPKPAKFTIR
jgi:hydroxyethylthiazole kinase-like sugar kinase family protein